MKQLITYIGLDVQKETIAVPLAEAGKRNEVREYLRRSVEPSHQHALSLSGRSRSPQEGSTRRVHATSPRHPQCNHADQDTMAMRVKGGVESIRSPAGMHRGGSRSKPPKAVAHRASLEAPRRMSDHQKAKRRLTSNTVAFSALFTLWLSTIQAVGLASRSACSRHFTYRA